MAVINIKRGHDPAREAAFWIAMAVLAGFLLVLSYFIMYDYLRRGRPRHEEENNDDDGDINMRRISVRNPEGGIEYEEREDPWQYWSNFSEFDLSRGDNADDLAAAERRRRRRTLPMPMPGLPVPRRVEIVRRVQPERRVEVVPRWQPEAEVTATAIATATATASASTTATATAAVRPASLDIAEAVKVGEVEKGVVAEVNKVEQGVKGSEGTSKDEGQGQCVVDVKGAQDVIEPVHLAEGQSIKEEFVGEEEDADEDKDVAKAEVEGQPEVKREPEDGN